MKTLPRSCISTLRVIILLTGSLIAATSMSSEGRYMDASEYLRLAFPDGDPEPSTLWMTSALRESVETALGFGIDALRVRYWNRDGRTAWILDEIGKVQPITIGVVVEDDHASTVRVLEFRESRGWEVRYPFFTDQFNDVGLDAAAELDGSIDGITGATLSVEAVTKVVRLALFLSRLARDRDG